MTFARLWAVLAIALPVLGSLVASLPTVDLAYHLRAGGQFLDTGVVPRVDTFTFTVAGQPWDNQQWGAQVLLAAVDRVAGWGGLAILRAALVGLTFGLLLAACRQQGVSVRVAAWLSLAAFLVSSVTLGLRPQLFGMVLFAAVLVLTARGRDRSAAVWLAVPLTALWANLHGSFVLGPLVLGLAWLEDLIVGRERWREPGTHRMLAVTLAATAATLLNPTGPGVWAYAAGITVNPLITDRITEWQPTLSSFPENALFLGSVVILLVVLARQSGRRPKAVVLGLVWLAPFVVIGARAVRGLAWWPLIAVVQLASVLRPPLPSEAAAAGQTGTRTMRRLNLVVAGLVVLAAVAALPGWRPVDPAVRAPIGVVGGVPPGITTILRETARTGDRLFAPQPWASWFELEVPAAPVFIDSRIELFPTATWDEYDAVISTAPGWQGILDRYGVTIVVVAQHLGGLALGDALAAEPAWRELHADTDGRVFVRADRG